ncbi:hypothetical protein WG66_004668 [Moniliophthora roreri]|nr:hypothetical protein WG66_004668 [Moniliophthora roreri]
MYIPSPDDFARRVSDTGVGDSHNVLVYILLFGFTTFILSMFWPLIRLQYPCITIADLEAKEKKVYGLFQGAVKEGILVGQTMANMEMKQIEHVYLLSRYHWSSQIRTKNLGMASSMWFIYLGFHPQLVPELSAWYNDVDTLEKEIQFKIESDIRRRCHEEFQRRAEESESLSEYI